MTSNNQMADYRFCEVCEAPFTRNVGETFCKFLNRKTCSTICRSRLHSELRRAQVMGAARVVAIAELVPLTGPCFAQHNLNLRRGNVFFMEQPETRTLRHFGAYDSLETEGDEI